jgi:hypothetical protein
MAMAVPQPHAQRPIAFEEGHGQRFQMSAINHARILSVRKVLIGGLSSRALWAVFACLAWIPPTPILRRLFAAGTPQQRRKIIGGSWKTKATAVKQELERVTAPQLSNHVSFAHLATDAVLDGNQQAGQA